MHPIIEDNCLKCHGGVKQKGGLDLRTVGSSIEGGETDTALLPGSPEKSPLFQVVQIDSDPHMPPKKQLTPEEISSLREWIATLEVKPPVELILPDPDLDPTQVIDQLIART
jgi:mono/diheme cytochrome c family protein